MFYCDGRQQYGLCWTSVANGFYLKSPDLKDTLFTAEIDQTRKSEGLLEWIGVSEDPN